jgi:hypothetical protein
MTGFCYFKAASRHKYGKTQTLPRTGWEISAEPNNFGPFPSVKYVINILLASPVKVINDREAGIRDRRTEVG